MLQPFTGLRGDQAYGELMTMLARKNIVVRYGQVCLGIVWAFDVMVWICLARDSRI